MAVLGLADTRPRRVRRLSINDTPRARMSYDDAASRDEAILVRNFKNTTKEPDWDRRAPRNGQVLPEPADVDVNYKDFVSLCADLVSIMKTTITSEKDGASSSELESRRLMSSLSNSVESFVWKTPSRNRVAANTKVLNEFKIILDYVESFIDDLPDIRARLAWLMCVITGFKCDALNEQILAKQGATNQMIEAAINKKIPDLTDTYYTLQTKLNAITAEFEETTTERITQIAKPIILNVSNRVSLLDGRMQAMENMVNSLLENRLKTIEDRQSKKDAKKQKWHRGYLGAEATIPELLARLPPDARDALATAPRTRREDAPTRAR